MNKNNINKLIQIGMSCVLLSASVYAGIPVWTFTSDPIYTPSVTLSTTATAIIKYKITNQSQQIHTLKMQPIQGITSSGCIGPLGYKDVCELTLNVNGSTLNGDVSGGPVMCEKGSPVQCYQPSLKDSLAIRLVGLTPSVSTLALSIQCTPSSSCTTTQNEALTGKPRKIIIHNKSSDIATNVTVTSSGLPSGTSITSNTCNGTLLAGGSCTIIVTPGEVASSDCTAGTAPLAGTVMVNADGGLLTSISVYVLSYACQYQGGFIYAVDDTTPNTGSIGGTVVALSDQRASSSGIIWSSNGSGGTGLDKSLDIIPWIADMPTSNDSYYQAYTTFNTIYSNTKTHPFPSPWSFEKCEGGYDGKCNSGNILALYNTYITNYGIDYILSTGPTNHEYYAAGICADYAIDSSGNSPCITGTCYDNWYLPAICEMGPKESSTPNTGCAVGTQNIFDNLLQLIGNSCSGIYCIKGSFWSSTEYASSPNDTAWYQTFTSSGGSQEAQLKYFPVGVRCSRPLTP